MATYSSMGRSSAIGSAAETTQALAPFLGIFWGLFTTLIVIGTVVAMLPNLPVIGTLRNLYLLNGLLLSVILFG
jgi:hypothetical protein